MCCPGRIAVGWQGQCWRRCLYSDLRTKRSGGRASQGASQCSLLVQQVPIYSGGIMIKWSMLEDYWLGSSRPISKWSNWKLKSWTRKKHTCADAGIDFWKSWISILGKETIWLLQRLAVFCPCGCYRLNRNLWNTIIKITRQSLTWQFSNPEIHIRRYTHTLTGIGRHVLRKCSLLSSKKTH